MKIKTIFLRLKYPCATVLTKEHRKFKGIYQLSLCEKRVRESNLQLQMKKKLYSQRRLATAVIQSVSRVHLKNRQGLRLRREEFD